MQRVLTDEEYLIEEPCASCENHYLEDIWNEYCCDMARCIHLEEYKAKEQVLIESGRY